MADANPNNDPPKPHEPDLDGFDDRLLLHIDHVFHTRINLFLLSQTVLVAALAIAWREPLGAAFVSVFAIAFTRIMYVPLARLAYGFEWLQRQVRKGQRHKTLNRFYRAYQALGRRVPFEEQIRKLKGSKKRYAVDLPRITTILWIVAGVIGVVRYVGMLLTTA